MKRRIGRFAVILSSVIFATAALAACRKKDDINEISRSFDYSQSETQTKHTEPDSPQDTSESTPDTETTTETKRETTSANKPTETETTTEPLTGAAVYFGDKNSVFNTLPMFDAGVFEEYFDKSYVEGLRFSQVKEKDYTSYLQSVLNSGKYTLNSQDGTRAYLAASTGKMCVTLIYKDGTMYIEAGESYWDILTLAEEETEAPTKPSEATDSRYSYFDNDKLVFSNVPYLTEGSFTGYEAVDNGGVMTFTGISKEAFDTYCEYLETSGYLFASSTPDGLTSYYVKDDIVVTITHSGTDLTLKVVKQQ